MAEAIGEQSDEKEARAVTASRYTNVMLTVIAICLMVLCVNTWHGAGKRALPVRVVNTEWSPLGPGILQVYVTNADEIAAGVDFPSELDVNVTNPELDVNVTNPAVPVESGY